MRAWIVGFLFLTTGIVNGANTAGAANYFELGEKELQKDNPKGALTYLEAALEQGSPTEKLYLYLGLAYERTDLRAEAKKVFKKGADLAGPLQYQFFYNLASLAAEDKDFPTAEENFQACLALRPRDPQALLNRANERLQSQNYTGAVDDYKQYLVADPASSQRSTIEALIGRLTKAASDKEAQRLADLARQKQAEDARKAEEARKAAEAARLAEEEKHKQEEAARLAEEEKRRQAEILAKIQNSLKNSGQNGENLSTGTGGTEHKKDEYNLSD